MTLKRNVLHEQALGSTLAGFPTLIRALDTATLAERVTTLEGQLAP